MTTESVSAVIERGRWLTPMRVHPPVPEVIDEHGDRVQWPELGFAEPIELEVDSFDDADLLMRHGRLVDLDRDGYRFKAFVFGYLTQPTATIVVTFVPTGPIERQHECDDAG
jgi:hypothetical protein